MTIRNNILPDRKSVAQFCDREYCQNQFIYTHPIQQNTTKTKLISCEDHPPENDDQVTYYWDTHIDQIEQRLQFAEERENLFLNLICENPVKSKPLNQHEKIVYSPYVFDKKTSDYAHLKADHELAFEVNKGGPVSELSLIIPTFGHHKELKKVLKSLSHQKPSSELIIVGTKSEEEILKRLLACAPIPKIKLVTLNVERQLGDHKYAAGHMRNLGVAHSTSPKLLFMDSDILLPSYSIETFKIALETDDIIMPKRKHIRGVFERLFSRSTEREKDLHWHHFYSSPYEWSCQNAPWKYVSTYTLGVNKFLFLKLGGFNPSFNSYGFEDVEFGYRAYKNKASFKLLDFYVNHIFHHGQRSEYQNNEEIRQKLLTRTARIFYKIHRDPDIYQQLKYYLNEF